MYLLAFVLLIISVSFFVLTTQTKYKQENLEMVQEKEAEIIKPVVTQNVQENQSRTKLFKQYVEYAVKGDLEPLKWYLKRYPEDIDAIVSNDLNLYNLGCLYKRVDMINFLISCTENKKKLSVDEITSILQEKNCNTQEICLFKKQYKKVNRFKPLKSKASKIKSAVLNFV